MLKNAAIAVHIFFAASVAAQAQIVPQALDPYPLPSKTHDALGELARQSDVLILGEIHGTQEVPAVAAALLEPLTKLGYGALALEVPLDQQGPLTDWATGKTENVPSFFAKPFPDGRGNIQALSLIRTALSPPFRWRLICFDQSWQNVADEARGTDNSDTPPMPTSETSDATAVVVRRDADMAANLAQERSRLARDVKVLAICGNVHARTSNHRDDDNPLSKLWPSFAAKLQSDRPAWRVRSINIVLHSGGYFAMVGPDSETADPKSFRVGVQKIRATAQIEEAEAHRLDDEYWNWVLNLPRATPATFLAPPVLPSDF